MECLIYPAFSVIIPDNITESISHSFGKIKYYYIIKNYVIKPLEEGGLNTIDFNHMNGFPKPELATEPYETVG